MTTWMRHAWGEHGEAELPGAKHNARIVEYFKSTSYHASADEVPWCSAFACWTMERAGIRSTRSARARSWLDWKGGITLPLDAPVPGCIVVFRRGKNPAQGHVALYLAHFHDPAYVVVLGGNQGDRVSVARFRTADVLGYRWPADEPIPWAEVVRRDVESF